MNMGEGIEILKIILPAVIMLAVGMMCRYKKIISREGIEALKFVVVNITLPAVLLNAFATMTYSVDNVIITILMFGACIIAWGLGKALGKVFRVESKFIPFLVTGFEAGMLGYALFEMLYGNDKISTFACIDLGQVLFVFTLYKVLVTWDSEDKEKARIKDLVKDMFHSPIIITVIVGILLGASGFYSMLIPSGIAGVLDACTDFISAPTSSIILIAIGYDLVLSDISWVPCIKAVLLRVVVLLLLRCLIGEIFHIIGYGNTFDYALNIMFILPPPYVLPVFATDEKQRTYISSVLSVSTLASIVGFIILAIFV